MKNSLKKSVGICFLLATLLPAGCANLKSVTFPYKVTVPEQYRGFDSTPIDDALFSFDITADMRYTAGGKYQSSEYFLGTCQAIKKVGKGAFMISPGDIDPPQDVYDTVKKVLGDDYPWYPVTGNHESETAEDMVWLRGWAQKGIPNLVRTGPESCKETTFSFDYKNSHFVILNQYCDNKSDTGTNGDISETLYRWLKKDLVLNTKPIVFVIGHEPLVPMPDAESGRLRHVGDSLDAHPENSRRFHSLMRQHNVLAYLCGHTHNYSAAKIDGLWQFDAGHCRGIDDNGAKSTFLKVIVSQGKKCYVEVYRDDSNGGEYLLTDIIRLR